MKKESFSEFVELTDIFNPEKFRIVDDDSLDLPCGYGEIPVLIKKIVRVDYEKSKEGEMVSNFRLIHGFTHPTPKINEIYQAMDAQKGKHIVFEDTEDRYLITFFSSTVENAVFCGKDEMKDFIAACYKPPEFVW